MSSPRRGSARAAPDPGAGRSWARVGTASSRPARERIDAPTPYVWIIGRTQTNGPADYDAVHQVQSGINLRTIDGSDPTPKTFTPDPSVDMETPPLQQVNALSTRDFLAYGAELMKLHPPHLTDWSTVSRLRRIGFRVGESFDWDSLDAETQQALEPVAQDGLLHLLARTPSLANVVNGWQMNLDSIGVYGNFYVKRAIVSMIGLGANLPEDAVYPLLQTDADGRPLDGANDYTIHFAADALPPVDAFWSVTMYDGDGFPSANELNRFAIGDRDALAVQRRRFARPLPAARQPGEGQGVELAPVATGPIGRDDAAVRARRTQCSTARGRRRRSSAPDSTRSGSLTYGSRRSSVSRRATGQGPSEVLDSIV